MVAKTGFLYYNVDTDRYQDIRIKRLKKEYGCAGITVYDYLLCEIYKGLGYGLELEDDFIFDVSEYFHIKEQLVVDIIDYCGSLGLFEQSMTEKGKLTSVAIQKRFLKLSSLCKRKNINIPEEYRIVPEKSAEVPEKKAKDPESEESQDDDVSIDYKEFVQFFNNQTKGKFGMVRHPLSEKRRKFIRARAREHGKESLAEVIKKASASDFMSGQNRGGWTPTFDWLFLPTNFEKVLSGNYDNKEAKENAKQKTVNNPQTNYRNEEVDIL